MKLVYFYIQSYGCLQDRGFLFDARYSVTTKKGHDGIHVSVKETGDCLDNILYGNVSFTAIVGDNGAGKSTCLDALQAWLVDFDNNPGFVIWENDENLFYQPGPQCKVRVDKTGMELKEYKKGEVPLPLNAVFFSDVLDDRTEIHEISESEEANGGHSRKYKDISTKAKYLYYLKEREGYPVRELQMNDSLLQIQLVEQLSGTNHGYPWSGILGEKHLNFQTINYSYLRQRIHWNPRLYSSEEDLTTIFKLLYCIRRTEHKFKEVDIIRETLFFDYIERVYTFVRELQYQKRKDVLENLSEIFAMLFSEYWDDDKAQSFLENVFCRFNQDNYLRNMERVIAKYPLKEHTFYNFEWYVNLHHQIMQMPWIAEKIKENHKFMRNWYRSIRPLDIIISIDIPEGTSVQALYSGYICAHTYNDFLKFKWDMSSGENSICLLFARLFEAINSIRIADEDKNSYLLMIDEIDNLYHPKWQQKIMNWITQFLNNKFPGYEFQVIITTHSPVLLSDIPESRVIFMPKEGVWDNGVRRHSETFAANIATLYYDAFFMHEGSIGEIAKTSVDMLYEILSNNTEEQKEIDETKEVAQTIFNDESEIRRYILPRNQSDINHNKSVLFESIRRTLKKRYRSNYVHELKINENNAADIVSHLVEIVGEDIWREQLRVMFNKYFTLGNTQETIADKILKLLPHCTPEERAVILGEIQKNDSDNQETGLQ